MVANALMRIEHNHRLAKTPSSRLYRPYLIRVTSDDNKTFNIRLRRINHHFYGEVYVRPLFFQSHNPHQSILRNITLLALRFGCRHQDFVLFEKATYHFDFCK